MIAFFRSTVFLKEQVIVVCGDIKVNVFLNRININGAVIVLLECDSYIKIITA